MDKVEEIRIGKLLDCVEQDNLGDALEHLQHVVDFKCQKYKNEIIEKNFPKHEETK